MPKAMWHGRVIAESDVFVTVEGNVYFPAASLKREYFRPSDRHTVCGWKGTASYYDVVVDGETNPAARWSRLMPPSGIALASAALTPVRNVCTAK